MKQGIPKKWLTYTNNFSMLEEAVDWEPLREWSLSDVQRVTFKSGDTAIAKMGHDSMAGEMRVYQSLLEPFNLPRPRLYDTYENATSNIFLMEDLGKDTIEMNPLQIHFVNAARRLAEIRKMATCRMSSLNSSIYQNYFKSQEDVLEDINFIMENQNLYTPDELGILKDCLEELPKHLDRLYREHEVTITHNDYNAKNLMITNQSIIPIDWSNAYLSPHLGDLYCLINEAEDNGIDKSVVIEAYSELDKSYDIEWQIQVGGICWLLHGLCWVCKEGIHKVPVTRSWMPPMISSINECFKQI
ncbi:hypothetical protein E3U55_12335 [Filobacillus milosensis]|uniref:Aminoglycoside phosphotransferase domain-containing protein n=1 Tax=Filobacillus milosensis TaxID=94137 RepID=A0A4Y8IIG9_9BACI|nr:phosphotransferase [Filobacillus milosensis]TFB15035.1 hypothetical protein E3U55_12335 [Filobacillus milosensis]